MSDSFPSLTETGVAAMEYLSDDFSTAFQGFAKGSANIIDSSAEEVSKVIRSTRYSIGNNIMSDTFKNISTIVIWVYIVLLTQCIINKEKIKRSINKTKERESSNTKLSLHMKYQRIKVKYIFLHQNKKPFRMRVLD